MCRLVESIKIENQTICNLLYHNRRMNNARKSLFNCTDTLDLKDYIKIPAGNNQILKYRVLYKQTIEKIEFHVYQKKNVKSLKLVYCDDIDYSFKYELRDKLDELLEQKGDCDNILIVKNGHITDTTFSNIIFFDGKNWITPDTFLLNGTTRQRLLEEKKIIQREIQVKDLKNYSRAKFINCMLSFSDNEYLEISRIKT